MDELLIKPVILNDLTEEEWKQVQQLKNKKKPSVPFSKATLDHCVRLDGLALDLRYIEPIGFPAPTLHIRFSLKKLTIGLLLHFDENFFRNRQIFTPDCIKF